MTEPATSQITTAREAELLAVAFHSPWLYAKGGGESDSPRNFFVITHELAAEILSCFGGKPHDRVGAFLH
jgi:hypothetical protein